MSQEKINKILRQIAVLMTLADNSPYPEECASALNKARLLMMKYNISESELSSSDPSDGIIEIDFAVAKSATNYTINLSYWLSEAFNVRCLMVKRNIGEDQIKFESSIRFIGKQSDVSVATYVYCYMCSILNTKATEYAATHKGKKIKESFSMGFIDSVCEKLKILKAENDKKIFTQQETEQINALVIATNALINQYMKNKYGEDLFEGGGNKVEFSPDAYRDGIVEGNKHGIFRGVEETKKKTKLIKR
jgi:hypothetical protein